MREGESKRVRFVRGHCGIAKVRDCEIARRRECEIARLPHYCNIAGLGNGELAREWERGSVSGVRTRECDVQCSVHACMQR